MKKKIIQRMHVIFLIGFLMLGGLSAPSWGAEGDLRDAAYKGDLARVKSLIAAKTDVNAQHKAGGTALMWASVGGHVEVVRTLLAAKADVNAKNNDGRTALMEASKGHDDVVKLLKKAGAIE